MSWMAKKTLVIDGKTYQPGEIVPHAWELAGFPLLKAMHRIILAPDAPVVAPTVATKQKAEAVIKQKAEVVKTTTTAKPVVQISK